MTCVGPVLGFATLPEVSWSRSNSFWDTCQFKRPSAILAASSGFVLQLTTASESSLAPKPLGGSGRIADQPRNERDSLRSNDHGNQIVDLVAEFRRIRASLLDASNCARKEMGRSRMRDSFRQSSLREQVDNGFQISLK